MMRDDVHPLVGAIGWALGAALAVFLQWRDGFGLFSAFWTLFMVVLACGYGRAYLAAQKTGGER